MADMVELKRKDTDGCCFPSEYPVGFFLDPHMVKALGLEKAEPGQTYKIVGEITIKSVTRKEESTDLYACMTKAMIGGESKTEDTPTAKDKMAESYGVKDGGKQG